MTAMAIVVAKSLKEVLDDVPVILKRLVRHASTAATAKRYAVDLMITFYDVWMVAPGTSFNWSAALLSD